MTDECQACLNALDKLLGRRFYNQNGKVDELRAIAKAATRMADVIERLERDQERARIRQEDATPRPPQ
jgi:hypothetical protein